MRVLRTFFWAAVLAAGFVYITGVTNWDVGRGLRPVRNAGRMWSEPTTAASAGFSGSPSSSDQVRDMNASVVEVNRFHERPTSRYGDGSVATACCREPPACLR